MTAPFGKLHRYADPYLDREIANLYRLVAGRELDERSLDLDLIARQIAPRLVGLGPFERVVWGTANTDGATLKQGSGDWVNLSTSTLGVTHILMTTPFASEPHAMATLVNVAGVAMAANPVDGSRVIFNAQTAGVDVEFCFLIWI